jgi:hypothetical protein
MGTMPGYLVAVALGERLKDLEATLEPHGRELGERVELDLESLRQSNGALAEELETYKERCQLFWTERPEDRATGAYTGIRRELGHWQQRNTKSEKKDLSVELEALEDLPGLGEVLSDLTSKDPDFDKLTERVADLGGSLTVEGDWSTLEVALSAAVEYPLALGGGPSMGEVRRRFRVRVSHAPWRDRKNRRLAEVTAWAEEIWPLPL